MSERLRVAILGSTGSVGRQALEVVAAQPDRIEVVALTAHSRFAELAEQAIRFPRARLALAEESAAVQCAALTGRYVGSGAAEVVRAATDSGADVVLNALVGAAGLRATIATLDAGLILALANKESLVVGGELVTSLAAPGQVLPVDSEHSAIFQCYLGEPAEDVTRIWLTASGGPFRGRSRDQLKQVTAEEALAHPTWNMGPKITVDSATLMNKGLEVIEAHHLFGVGYDDITVVVHPQSCVHSMIEFRDGSVKAHLGATDMRVPIQYAFSHPHRWSGTAASVDFTSVGPLEFGKPDPVSFGCLALAYSAGREGGTAPAILNAANEVAVAAFLQGRCGFLAIEDTVRATLDMVEAESIDSLEHIEEVDRRARVAAGAVLRGTT